MRVPDDWDRPHAAPGAKSVAASYYPPLRIKDPSEGGGAQFSANGGGGAFQAGHNGSSANGLNGSAAGSHGSNGYRDAFSVSGRASGDACGDAFGRREDHHNGRDASGPSAGVYDGGFGRSAAAQPRDSGTDIFRGGCMAGVGGSTSEVSSTNSTTASASDFRFGGGDFRGFRAEERPGFGGPVVERPSSTSFASPAPPMPSQDFRHGAADGRGGGARGFDLLPESGRTPSLPSTAAAPVSSELGDARGGRSAAAPLGGGEAAPDVEVRGSGTLPGAWSSWDLVDFPSRVRSPLVAAGFPAPTVIQQSAWPILTLGRDLIGIAKTGSGKTLAFLLPAFARLVESRAVDLRGPPAVLVMAPTRELACQIEQEAKRFGAVAGMRAACLYGGAPKGPQLAELRGRPQVLVATPGRLNDLLDPPLGLSKAVDIDSVRYLVLDEADRMLDMGFEPQIRKIIAGLPKDRQTLMFTATWPVAVRRLAAEFLRDPVEVRVGEVDSLRVNPDVEQRVDFCLDSRDKEDRLVSLLREHATDQAIVFVNTKRMCEIVAMRCENSVAIHGDKDQRERDMALAAFKSGTRRVMVATDVAARGLDVKAVRLVINFDPPNRDEDYVHRVGRTGRAGNKGTAITLLTNEDGTAGRFIADILKRDNLPVPQELERRLATGEMRMGGGGGRDPSRGPSRMRGRSRGPMGGDPFADDFDFDVGPGFGASRFGDRDRFAPPRRNDEYMNMCATDCPTY